VPIFLTCGQKRPHLRLLDWERGEERDLSGVGNVFADYVIPRNGWIALCYDMRAVALPDGVSGKRLLTMPGLHPVPHQDPALLWLTDENAVATPRDRFGAAAGPPIILSSGWLTAAYDGAWLQRDPEKGDDHVLGP
jgi:hypothetical protein